MKVLFAVSSESISDAIVKKYQKQYKEILSYKNVYYFNAILKEIQKDKSYDRIIISEDLEAFSNNNYEAIDKFIFEKLDDISDEAQDIDGNETSIILICGDRHTKGSSFLVKLFGIGIYNALLGTDRSMDNVCKLINKPRVKKEAKVYYKIDAEDVNYSNKSDNEVSELEIQNILTHFRKLGRNTDKYAESFNSIAAQYTDDQLKIVVNCLPINVKAVLEEECLKYQQLMSVNGVVQKVNSEHLKSKEARKQTGIKIDMIENKSNQNKISGPIVIPASVRNSGKTKKQSAPAKKVSASIPEVKIPNESTITKRKVVKQETVKDIPAEEEYKIVKKKKVMPDGTVKIVKVKVPLEKLAEKKEKVQPKTVVKIEEEKPVEKTTSKRGRPKKKEEIEDSDEDIFLPGIDDDFEEDTLPAIKDNSEDDIELPGMTDDFEDDNSLPGLDDITEDDNLLPGLDDDFEDNTSSDDDSFEIEDTFDEDDSLDSDEDTEYSNDNSFEIDNEFEEDDDLTDEVDLPGLDDLDDIDNILPENEDDEEDLLSGLEDDDESVIEETKPKQNTEIESIKPRIDYSMSSLNSLLTKDKKIVTFIGTTKNGTSFLVNNLAAMFSAAGINTAILDMTKNKNSYYIYTNNEEELRNIAYNSISKLQKGFAEGIKVGRNLSVYTSLPNDGKDYSDAESILSTLVQNHSLVLIDCDFDTDPAYFASCQEIYLVQSMDILTIQPLTGFLRDLKTKGVLESEKVRVVINKEMKVRSLTTKAIIGGMSFYNDPSMSFMTELFNKDMVKACSIPFEDNVYARYLDAMVNCNVSVNGYSKTFISKLKNLGEMVYPLAGKSSYGANTAPQPTYGANNFSGNMGSTLSKMKKTKGKR